MLTKIISFAMAIASRGLSNKQIDIPTKQLRVLSCFGNKDISSCPNLERSKKSEYYYCKGCGCGDKKQTWLLKDIGEYAKLDYPVLNCPYHMPGFSNYDPNYKNNSIAERKQKIENFDPENLKYINITVNSNPLIHDSLDKLNKILENS